MRNLPTKLHDICFFQILGGGAVAVLSYLGIAKENSLSPNLKITLLLFVVGIILCGITIMLLLHRFDGLLKNWSNLIEKFFRNELDYFEMLKKDRDKYSKTTWGWLTGYGSFLCFISGVIIAIWPIFISPSPVYADTLEGITSEQIAWDQILGISTVIIAVTAILFTWWQILILKKHNRLSVVPILDIEMNLIPNNELDYRIINFGIGVAAIKKIEIIIDGNRHTIDTSQKVNEILKILNINDIGIDAAIIHSEAYIKPGGYLKLFSYFKDNQNETEIIKFINAMRNFQIEIKYESLYEVEKTLIFPAN